MNKYFRRFRSLLDFYFQATTIHNVHSPAAYLLAEAVFAKGASNQLEEAIEGLRSKLYKAKGVLSGLDTGHRSGSGRKIDAGGYAPKTSCSPNMGQKLTRIIKASGAQKILELGTGIGIGTLFLASASSTVQVTSIHGHHGRQEIARALAEELGLKNIRFKTSMTEESLSLLIKEGKTFDLIYLDGDDQGNAVFQYAKRALHLLKDGGLLILGDIRLTNIMEQGWNELIDQGEWGVGLDFYSFGILKKGKPAPELIRFKLLPYWMKPWKAGFFISF